MPRYVDLPESSGPPETHRLVSALLLCGGRGLRMEGTDKGLVNWQGKPLIEHVLQNLPPLAATFISANRNLDRYAAYGHPVVADDRRDIGPLGGVLAVRALVKTPWLIVFAADAPLVPTDVTGQLLAACEHNTAAAGCVTTERLQPLPLLVSRSALGSLGEYLSTQRSVQGWIDTLEAVVIDERPRADKFANFNYVADLQNADPD